MPPTWNAKPTVPEVKPIPKPVIIEKTPWFKFWHYKSGPVGGIIFGTMLFLVLFTIFTVIRNKLN